MYTSSVGRNRRQLHFTQLSGEDLLASPHIPKQSNPTAKTALDEAAEHGQASMVKLLLQHRGGANARNREGRTALHWFATSGKRMYRGISTDHDDTVHALIKARADVNAGVYGHKATLLRPTAISNTDYIIRIPSNVRGESAGQPIVINIEAARALLRNGAHVNATMMNRRTALHEACLVPSFGMTELLLRHRADEKLEDDVSCATLHLLRYDRD